MENQKNKRKKLSTKIVPAALSFAQLSIIWLMIIFVLSIFEIVYNGILHQFPKNFAAVLGWSFLNDLVFWCKGLIYVFLVYIVFHLISAKFARIAYCVFIVFMAVVQLSLTSYFTTALVPLGADLYSYSMVDIKQTVGAAGGVNFLQIIGFIVVIGGTSTLFVLYTSLASIFQSICSFSHSKSYKHMPHH